jgi:hypothetical protein
MAQAPVPTVGVPSVKKPLQLDLHGQLAVPLFTQSITVPSFCKKNGTIVGSHTRRIIRTVSSKSRKKATTQTKLQFARTGGSAKFQAPDDCKASVSLAHSLRIEELQILMRGERK